MRTSRRGGAPRGFTLLELALVLVVTAILAALAVTIYNKIADKARMTQAQTTLKHLQKTETVYFTENERYTDNLVLLDFDPEKYTYYVISVVLDNSRLNYTGIATGVEVMAGDRWTIRRDGDPQQDNASTFR